MTHQYDIDRRVNVFVKDFAKTRQASTTSAFEETVETTHGPPHNREFGVKERWLTKHIHPRSQRTTCPKKI
jgi:hypothetical protein